MIYLGASLSKVLEWIVTKPAPRESILWGGSNFNRRRSEKIGLKKIIMKTINYNTEK